MMKRCLAPATAACLLLPAAAPAAGLRQTVSYKFTTTRPGAATGYEMAADFFDPANPAGKPYAVKQIVLTLPKGTTIDTSVPVKCTATDVELMLLGAAACPPASQIGGGTIVTDTGSTGPPFPRFVPNTVWQFNNTDEVVALAESSNPQTRVVTRSPINGTTITSSTGPPFPGSPPPDPFTAFRTLRLSGAPYVVGDRAYTRTPRTCPASRRWEFRLQFTYRDGVVQTVQAFSPCRRP